MAYNMYSNMDALSVVYRDLDHNNLRSLRQDMLEYLLSTVQLL